MIHNLQDELLPALNDATELYVAVALMKDYGLDIIEKNIPSQCQRKYLVGINLPTTPTVLKRLLELGKIANNQVLGRIYETGETYHPKVYIVRSTNRSLIAFIGSANATKGGLSSNVEMSIQVKDQDHCERLLHWFDDLFMKGKTFDESYIEKYEISYRRNKSIESTRKSNIDSLTNQNLAVPGINLNIPEGQFYRESDFQAFDSNTHLLDTEQAVRNRRSVRERMIELNYSIVPRFHEYGIENLNNPANKRNYTSYYWHSRGNTHIPMDAIWLHYGKSTDELERFPEGYHQRFVHHLRIQVILRNSDEEAYIGIWLYVAQNNGSYYDRRNLINKLGNPEFEKNIYDLIINLGGAYWITINNNDLYVSDLTDRTELSDFLKQDNYSGDYIIGRNYPPDHPDLRQENIVETVLVEFSKLYKIYDLFKAEEP